MNDKKITLRTERIETVTKRVIDEIFNRSGLSVHEAVAVLGQVMHSMGASLAGYKDKGPTFDQLQKLYYEQPNNFAVAIMINGLLMQSWMQDINEDTISFPILKERENK